MKIWKICTTLLMSVALTGFQLAGQAGEEVVLSLKAAQDMAVQNNIGVVNARLDQKAARLTVIETIANGLPRVDLTGSFTDNLKLMTTLLPGEFFGQPGTKIPVTFGSQFNTNSSIQASMLIFNAPYLMAIETTKLAKKLSDQNLEKSELDTREAVSTTYFLILVSESSRNIMLQNLANLNETLKATRAMFSAGMAEATDVDQMASSVKVIENAISSMERNIEVNYNFLRLQLGLTPEQKIKLTDNLENLILKVDVEALLSQKFDVKQNIDYRMMDNAEQMSMQVLKTQKAAVLPTLAGFYSYGVNGMGDKVAEQQWFKNSMAGLQLSFPIFASGQRYIAIRKAQINLEKTRYTKDLVTNQISLQEKQLRYNLVSANQQFRSQKENVDISKRVFASTENKYRQGMASSLDLTQANTLYLQAESSYVQALFNVLQSKLALDKLLNNM